jgi:hypothetical protein
MESVMDSLMVISENLSAESVHDLEYWLNGILKKAKRRAGIKEEEKTKHKLI